MSKAKPLPCPFCGSRKIKPLHVDNENVHAICYQCLNCNARSGVIFGREPELVTSIALEAWNSRGKIRLNTKPPSEEVFGREVDRVLPDKPAYYGWQTHFRGRRK